MTRNWLGICDSCGRRFKGTDLRERWDGAFVCASDWEPRHSQDFSQPARGDPKPLQWSRNDPDLTSPGTWDIQPLNVFNTDGAIGEGDINVGGSTGYVIVTIMEGIDVPIIVLPDAGGKTIIINNWGDLGIIDDQYSQTVTVQGTGARTPAVATFTTSPAGGTIVTTQTAVVGIYWKGSLVTEFVRDITLSVTTGAGTLSGTNPVTATAGVSTFSDLTLDADGTHQLTATGLSTGVTNISTGTSDTFVMTVPDTMTLASKASLGVGLLYTTMEFHQTWQNNQAWLTCPSVGSDGVIKIYDAGSLSYTNTITGHPYPTRGFIDHLGQPPGFAWVTDSNIFTTDLYTVSYDGGVSTAYSFAGYVGSTQSTYNTQGSMSGFWAVQNYGTHTGIRYHTPSGPSSYSSVDVSGSYVGCTLSYNGHAITSDRCYGFGYLTSSGRIYFGYFSLTTFVPLYDFGPATAIPRVTISEADMVPAESGSGYPIRGYTWAVNPGTDTLYCLDTSGSVIGSLALSVPVNSNGMQVLAIDTTSVLWMTDMVTIYAVDISDAANPVEIDVQTRANLSDAFLIGPFGLEEGYGCQVVYRSGGTGVGDFDTLGYLTLT